MLSRLPSLDKVRLDYKCVIPKQLAIPHVTKRSTITASVASDVADKFPNTSNAKAVDFAAADAFSGKALRVGAVLSGGPAPGGHNVLCGLYDGLKKLNSDSTLYGFLSGPSGLVDNQYKVVDQAMVDAHRNQGGFDMLGSGRTKIESADQFERVKKTVTELKLDGLVVIGGDDSNTNAAVMAEWFAAQGVKVNVVGVPKTIDGDLKDKDIEISFGFDTATKLYSELIGNVMRDARSGRKYYHFIRLMGRAASHVALECALATRPNIALIAEEAFEEKMTLGQIINHMADVVVARHKAGKNYGVIVFPEGLIEHIPRMHTLIDELNNTVLPKLDTPTPATVLKALGPDTAETFAMLPADVQGQLLLDRDSHGNIQISRIETEKLLISLLTAELDHRTEYKGKFDPVSHFFGYEGRAGLPSNFDCTYCLALGLTAASLINGGHNGCMAAVQGLTSPPEEWVPRGVPITGMINMEVRHGAAKPVIKKALVELGARPFGLFKEHRDSWEVEDGYVCVGPLQFEGPCSMNPPITLLAEQE